MNKRASSTARWWVTGGTVVVMLLTAALGHWQLRRAAQKEVLAAQQLARASLPALGWDGLGLTRLAPGAQALHDRRVSVRGRWMSEATVFLDNRPLQGRAGFWVITPLRPLETGVAPVLVVRGWVPRRFDDRTAVPDVPDASGDVQVEGRIAPAPSKLYELGPESGGRIRQNIDLAAYSREWSLPLLPVSVWQTGDSDLPPGWSRDWPQANVDVHKHYGYAFQWFGLCLLMAILYVWFQFIAPRRRG